MSKPRTRTTFQKTSKCQIRTNVGSIGLGADIGSPSPAGTPSPPPPLLLTFETGGPFIASPATTPLTGISVAALVVLVTNSSVSSVTDDAGNSYSLLGKHTGSSTFDIEYWYADTPTSPTNLIVGWDDTDPDGELFVVNYELSRSAVVDDGPNFANGPNASPFSMPAVTGAGSDCLFLGTFGLWDSSGVNKVFDLGGSWSGGMTALLENSGNTHGNNQSYAVFNAFIEQAGGGAFTSVWTGSLFNITPVGSLVSSIVIR